MNSNSLTNLFNLSATPRLSEDDRAGIKANVMAAWDDQYAHPSHTFKWWLLGPSLALATILFVIVIGRPMFVPTAETVELDKLVAELEQIEF